jgi:hypothetical protein
MAGSSARSSRSCASCSSRAVTASSRLAGRRGGSRARHHHGARTTDHVATRAARCRPRRTAPDLGRRASPQREPHLAGRDRHEPARGRARRADAAGGRSRRSRGELDGVREPTAVRRGRRRDPDQPQRGFGDRVRGRVVDDGDACGTPRGPRHATRRLAPRRDRDRPEGDIAHLHRQLHGGARAARAARPRARGRGLLGGCARARPARGARGHRRSAHRGDRAARAPARAHRRGPRGGDRPRGRAQGPRGGEVPGRGLRRRVPAARPRRSAQRIRSSGDARAAGHAGAYRRRRGRSSRRGHPGDQDRGAGRPAITPRADPPYDPAAAPRAPVRARAWPEPRRRDRGPVGRPGPVGDRIAPARRAYPSPGDRSLDAPTIRPPSIGRSRGRGSSLHPCSCVPRPRP